jgi:hypothetical protein
MLIFLANKYILTWKCTHFSCIYGIIIVLKHTTYRFEFEWCIDCLYYMPPSYYTIKNTQILLGDDTETMCFCVVMGGPTYYIYKLSK